MPSRLNTVRPHRQYPVAPVVLVALIAVTVGCQPTVKVEAPDKPITINLNVRIEQEVRIRIEEDAKKLLEEKKDLF